MSVWVYENACPMWRSPDTVGGGVSIAYTSARSLDRSNAYVPSSCHLCDHRSSKPTRVGLSGARCASPAVSVIPTGYCLPIPPGDSVPRPLLDLGFKPLLEPGLNPRSRRRAGTPLQEAVGPLVVQGRVAAAAGDEDRGWAVLDDPAGFDDQDPVGDLHCGQSVG